MEFEIHHERILKEIGWLCYYHYIILIYIILCILISCFFFRGGLLLLTTSHFCETMFFQSGLLGSASPVQDTGRTNEDGGETGNDSLVMSVCLLNGLHNLGTWNGHWLWLFVPLSEKKHHSWHAHRYLESPETWFPCFQHLSTPFLSGIPQGSVEAPSSTDSPYANDRVHVTWECQKDMLIEVHFCFTAIYNL